uniref:Uncharacterized protein n=1 Tax=Meloidogyne enterolobii TaxID=390850 RepID=A0A6V7XPQ1_MELEN|nr:unnamed protein product [Meloidogyne enterolobii]
MRHFLHIYILALKRKNNGCFYVHKMSQLEMLLSDRGTWQLVDNITKDRYQCLTKKDVHVNEEEQAAKEVHVLKIKERIKCMIKEMKIEYLRGTSLLII